MAHVATADEVLRVVGSTKLYRLIGADGHELVSAIPGTLGGHRRTRVYGRLDCPVALSLIARGFDMRHRVFFADEATAVAAGYRPCGACMREEYRRWKADAPGASRVQRTPTGARTKMHRAGGDSVRPSD